MTCFSVLASLSKRGKRHQRRRTDELKNARMCLREEEGYLQSCVPPTLAPRKTVVVLVVEDDPATRELFRSALQYQGGYTVVAVEDGVDALRYLDTDTPDAIVLDLGLPRLHGRDVIAEMAAHGLLQEIPVILVTGDAGAGLRIGDLGRVLRKPADAESLLAAVQKCLSAARDRRE